VKGGIARVAQKKIKLWGRAIDRKKIRLEKRGVPSFHLLKGGGGTKREQRVGGILKVRVRT